MPLNELHLEFLASHGDLTAKQQLAFLKKYKNEQLKAQQTNAFHEDDIFELRPRIEPISLLGGVPLYSKSPYLTDHPVMADLSQKLGGFATDGACQIGMDCAIQAAPELQTLNVASLPIAPARLAQPADFGGTMSAISDYVKYGALALAIYVGFKVFKEASK